MITDSSLEESSLVERYKFTISYNGTAFSGFQRQGGTRTVQLELENALPWDSIKSQKYDLIGAPEKYASVLKKKLDERIAADPAYKVTLEQIQLAKETMDKQSVSLNLAERKAKKDGHTIIRSTSHR